MIRAYTSTEVRTIKAHLNKEAFRWICDIVNSDHSGEANASEKIIKFNDEVQNYLEDNHTIEMSKEFNNLCNNMVAIYVIELM